MPMSGLSAPMAFARPAAMPTSFAIRPSAKPEANWRDTTCCFATCSVQKLWPDEASMTSTMAPGSRPNFRPTSSASDTAMNAVPATKLFSAFMAWPLPGPPTANSRLPILASTGLAASTAAGVAADHDRERTIRGARHAAGHRCVDEGEAAFGEIRMGCPRADRVGGAHVDDERAFRKIVRERAAFGLEQAGAHLLAGRQHGDDGVGLLPHLGEGRGGFCADVLRGLLRPRRVEVIDDDLHSRPSRDWPPSAGPCCRCR